MHGGRGQGDNDPNPEMRIHEDVHNLSLTLIAIANH
jgi:hypothetical protein